jgi:hypothetical protein
MEQGLKNRAPSLRVWVHQGQAQWINTVFAQKVVLNLAQPEFSPGLSYVAASRVKSLRGLLVEEAFDLNRFSKARGKMGEMPREDIKRRRDSAYTAANDESEAIGRTSTSIESTVNIFKPTTYGRLRWDQH